MQRTIVVGFDASERAADALALGVQLARAERADLLAAYVFGGPPQFAHDPQLLRRLDGRLAELRRDHARCRERPVALRVLPAHDAAEGLEQLAREQRASAIVVGSSEQSPLGRVLIGSTPERLLHGSPCAVAIAPAGYADAAPERLREIGVAVDEDEEAAPTVARAAALAAAAEARLHAITVVRAQPGIYVAGPVSAAEYAAEVAADRAYDSRTLRAATAPLAAAGVAVSVETPTGTPAVALTERSRTLDLLVLGSRAQGPLRRVLLGSVSTHLVRHAACPLLVLPRGAQPAADAARVTTDREAEARADDPRRRRQDDGLTTSPPEGAPR